MTNEILDNNSTEKIKIRSSLLNWVELFLFLLFAYITVDSCYFFISNPNWVSPILLLLIFSNFKFVYSSRKATLIYEATQDSKEIKLAKKSSHRVIFICTAIGLCFLSIALINNFVIMIKKIGGSSMSGFISWNGFFDWHTTLNFAVISIFPILQIYYMVKTSRIFNAIVKD